MLWLYFLLGIALFGLLFLLTEETERWEKWN
jgi:hypothetical protein